MINDHGPECCQDHFALILLGLRRELFGVAPRACVAIRRFAGVGWDWLEQAESVLPVQQHALRGVK
jgi:hypothetical protein